MVLKYYDAVIDDLIIRLMGFKNIVVEPDCNPATTTP